MTVKEFFVFLFFKFLIFVYRPGRHLMHEHFSVNLDQRNATQVATARPTGRQKISPAGRWKPEFRNSSSGLSARI